VYAVGHLALAPYANEQAAVFACGAGAVISHRSAAYLWGLLEAHPRDVEVTMVGRHCRPKAHVRIHRVATIDDGDVRLKHGLHLTAPARTVIEMAAEGSERELEAVIAEARIRGLLRHGELERTLEAAGFRKGTGRLRALLRAEGEPGITRSDGERRLRRLLRAAGLEQPISNVKIAGWEVDFLWPEQRVVLEFDSYAFHGHRAAFERDRRKDMALRDTGYTVIRITARQLRDQPFALIAHIARALERAARAAREAG
jgi:very-short-patch-repair endonuclease